MYFSKNKLRLHWTKLSLQLSITFTADFFGYKSYYNKNAYNIQNTRRILDIFDAEDDRYFDNESYGLIFHSGFVYVLYLSEKKLRGAKLSQQ